MTSPSLFYREIQLTKGQVALVDIEDYEWLKQWKWQAHWNKGSELFYATRSDGQRTGSKRRFFQMHREILGLVAGDPRKGDHIDPSKTLDNRRSNLRIATASQNTLNMRKRSGRTNSRKGVYRKRPGSYEARIAVGGLRIYLGSFRDFAKACEARAIAEVKYHGEFALKNDPTKSKKE